MLYLISLVPPSALYHLMLLLAGQADALIVLHPWFELVQTLSVEKLHLVGHAGALLIVHSLGPLPVVPGHHAHDCPLTLH